MRRVTEESKKSLPSVTLRIEFEGSIGNGGKSFGGTLGVRQPQREQALPAAPPRRTGDLAESGSRRERGRDWEENPE